MIGEINIAGVFISPLLLCMVAAFFGRLIVSKLLEALGLYRHIVQRSLFDTSLFFILIGVAFIVLRVFTSP